MVRIMGRRKAYRVLLCLTPLLVLTLLLASASPVYALRLVPLQPDLTLKVGDVDFIDVQGIPNVGWTEYKSSNPSVAQVTEGSRATSFRVQALGAGTTIITITATDQRTGESASAKFTVTVTGAETKVPAAPAAPADKPATPKPADTQKKALSKNEEMLRKYAAGDQEGAYQIFLELESTAIPGFEGFFIPRTDAQVANFQAALAKQNIKKSAAEIRSHAQEMDKLNRKLFRFYMQQDAQGVAQAAREINDLNVKFLKNVLTSQPGKVAPVPAKKEESPVIRSAPSATDSEIERWEKMLEDASAESDYLETSRKILNYIKTGAKLSGKLARVPLIGMIFDGINIPFDSLENYQMGDNIFKAFAKSLSTNTIHAVTNLILGTPVFLRNVVDEITGLPVEERPGVQDFRFFIKSINNVFWDNGFSFTEGKGYGGVGIEELYRRYQLGHYGNRYMDPDYNP